MTRHYDYTTYVVRRGGHVYHRATGLYLGTVTQADWGMDCSTSGAWHAYTPHGDEAVGDMERTRHNAIQHLMSPLRLDPGSPSRKRCRACRNTFPNPPWCADCESEADAIARDRAERPDEWAHYEAVCALPENESYRARSEHDQPEQASEVPDQGDDHRG